MISFPDHFYSFIEENLHTDPSVLRLRTSGKKYPFPIEFALIQIEARRKAGSKLEPYTSNPRFLFPTPLSAEQATDWRVAHFHSELLRGKRVLDLTAGLGIDALTAAERAESVTAVEIESEKCEVLRYNSHLMHRQVKVVCHSAESYIAVAKSDMYDVIFIDPARRSDSGHRVYGLADCSPDVISIMPQMLSVAPEILIKASPMLDITALLHTLENVAGIYVISLRGEVKEVLVRVAAEPSVKSPEIGFVMIKGDTTREFYVSYDSLGYEGVEYVEPGDVAEGSWLHEPDASLMKGAPWGELCRRYTGLKKVARDTHLFVCADRIPDFPGRVVRILKIMDKKSSHTLRGATANVTVRNYPTGAEALRKKLGIKDGGDKFLYAFRDSTGKGVMVLCEKTSQNLNPIESTI